MPRPHGNRCRLLTSMLTNKLCSAKLYSMNLINPSKSGCVQLLCNTKLFVYLFLVSIYLRLKIYVDDYQLTLLRVGVGLFLLLVMTGFVLLGYYIIQKKSFRWLVGSNVISTFTLFYFLQFTNLNGWIADYNVKQWLNEKGRPLDIFYLKRLGPPAWPALLQVAADQRGFSETKEVARELIQIFVINRSQIPKQTWQSWQWRKSKLTKQLQEKISVKN